MDICFVAGEWVICPGADRTRRSAHFFLSAVTSAFVRSGCAASRCHSTGIGVNPQGLGTLFAQGRRVGGLGSGGTVSRNFFLLSMIASIAAGVPRQVVSRCAIVLRGPSDFPVQTKWGRRTARPRARRATSREVHVARVLPIVVVGIASLRLVRA